MTDDQDVVLSTTVAHVRPEDAGKIGGAQDVDDKIQTHLRHIEAAANLPGEDGLSQAIWYGAVILSFMVGALFSGYDGSGGSDGFSNPMPIGQVDLTGVFDATAVLVEVMLYAG